MSGREMSKVTREAEITEALAGAGGPLTVAGIARALTGGLDLPKAQVRSHRARITQSLRVMERDGIVVRGTGQHRVSDWRLAR